MIVAQYKANNILKNKFSFNCFIFYKINFITKIYILIRWY
jgi:hypothetical protein